MLKKIIPFILVLLMGCIDPIDIKQKGEVKHLVVEGSFTNEASLNYIRLSYSQPYTHPYNQFEENASVAVVSSEGENYPFIYDKAGYYYPDPGTEAIGKVGHTYKLVIEAGGKQYQTNPVTLKAPIPIDSVHFEVDEMTYAFAGVKEKQLYPGYNLLVDYNDPAGEENFYRWSFTTQYEIRTQPEDYINPQTGLPAPKGCCSQCFIEEKMEQLTVLDDRLAGGRKVINQNVLFIPFERYLGVKNKLKVYQHSITNEAFNFFRILEQQKNATGTVFDPAPAEVKGNIFNVKDQEERVLGFFDVSGVSIKELTILRTDIAYPVPRFLFPDDCQKVRGATRIIPNHW